MLKIRNKLLYDKTKKLAFDGLRLAQDYLATDGNNFVSNYNEWQFIGGFSSFMQLNVQKTNQVISVNQARFKVSKSLR